MRYVIEIECDATFTPEALANHVGDLLEQTLDVTAIRVMRPEHDIKVNERYRAMASERRKGWVSIK